MEKVYLFILTCFLCSPLAQAQNLYFPPLLGDTWETVSPSSLGWCEDEINLLYNWLEERNTKAFVVLKDGKIVLENYFNGFGQDSLWYWASAGKTITALLTGIAQEEGYLSITDPTSEYLGEGWTSCTSEQEALIMVKDQLKMTTSMSDLFFNCTDPSCLFYVSDAGTRWSYHNGPYRLLFDVIGNAVAPDFNSFDGFHFTKLQLKTGMGGFWFHSQSQDLYFSTARAMARFGLLMLNNGNWNGNPVINDMDYFNQMITPSQDINESYGYLWWLNGYDSHMVPASQQVYDGPLAPDAPPSVFSAAGKDGQFVSIWPEENVVLVRMGENPDESAVPVAFHNDMWREFMKVVCETTPVKEIEPTKDFTIYPNPFQQELRVADDPNIKMIHLTNIIGNKIFSTSEKTLQLDFLPEGIYLLGIENINGKTTWRRVVKKLDRA